ncbi:MAG TPA: hypothetical protein VFO10_11185 [Oligoflexus sp.]|uniref:SH3 domain-containing protein n=1 Tax=Oligoflexus sp. TaxID=1971216 RepID=UPI002D7E38D5|nr:hypothetical protein [Oligoflexus sp.]HET9237808.1 hypothetical protein [Oligoflexus sp.]
MGRKKKRWRDMDDPADIFGGERNGSGEGELSDPAYDAFRRHIEEHIQGETRAFHELRSTAEHELQAAAVMASPAARSIPARKVPPQETLKAKALPPPAVMQSASRPAVKHSGMGTMIALSLIFTSLGFLLNTAWQQSQPASRKVAKARTAAEANCASERSTPTKKANGNAPKQTAMAAAPLAPLNVTPPVPVAPPPVTPPSPVEAGEQENLLKGMTLRAVELRKGPGGSFEIVDSLPPGFALEGVLTTDKQWLRVKPGAFVSADALQFQDPAAAGYQNFWVGPNIANIREFPLITARILRKAEPGLELKLQAFNQDWAQVAGGGFVFRKLVTQEAPKLIQLPAVMRVSVEKAEIRGGPGQQYPVLGLYFRNHKVEVQEMQGAWLRVGPDQFIRAQEMELSAKPNTDKTM